jgi:hypothetical protein
VPIDCFASEEHFADHLAPVYRALPEPGDFIMDSGVFERAPTIGGRWPSHVTHATDPTRPVLVASYGDVKRARRQGRTRIAFIEHGIGQSYGTGHGSYAGGKDRDDVGLFLVPNEYSANLWCRTYPDARVEIVGCPKLDDLPRKDPSVPLTVAIGFHWDCHLVPETVSAFNEFRFALESLRDAYRVIGHGHPRAWVGPPSLTKRYRRAGIEPVTDFREVCRQADLYICDNSSSLYEFAATGRSVVVMNSPSYRRDVHHGLRFWDAADVGIQVDRHADLLPAVAEALADAPALQQRRERALDMVYSHRSGAALRAAQALTAWV